MSVRGVAASLVTLACAPGAAQADAADAIVLDRVEVSVARLRDVPAFDVPASIGLIVVDGQAARAGSSVSEALDGIPGVAALERQNLAQDTQLSMRGFGARSTFGVRGVRLYADGIPATMPDGQGQVSHFNLAAAERIEVMRGPFSALYGNSSGGVIQIWSAEGQSPMHGHVQASMDRHDGLMLSTSLRGAGTQAGYALAASRFDTDGWRDHSAARREAFNARVHMNIAEAGRLEWVVNHFDSPSALDPLGLTWSQVQANPRQATAVATQFNTRKSTGQDQIGLRYQHVLGAGHSLEARAYAGERAVEQFLALPVGAQANPLNSGGNIDLDNRYAGGDARWNWEGTLAGREFQLTAGLSADRQRQHRTGYENFIGDTLGVRGALRRDERNRVEGRDYYAQAWWRFAENWALLAGVRRSDLEFRSTDHYVTERNPDDSGRVTYAETTPVLGLTYAPSENWRLYMSSGRGFETPTFNELGYRADGGAGLALDLLPATSRNIELGSKWKSDAGVLVEAAWFRADTDDELAVARNVGGRSSYRNVGSARRQGVELAAVVPLLENGSLRLAWTRLDATFRDSFPICTGSGCTDPSTLVAAGTRIPGTARDQLFARLEWHPARWTFALEGVGSGNVSVNDVGSQRAPGYAIANVEAARTWPVGAGSLRAFVRVDNLLDRAYIGSVIVNEGNGRYYEPAPGRSALFGVRWDWERAAR